MREEEDGGGVTGGPFPSIAWLHPHAAVETHNLATVARYNRYCGRGLNGGELAQVKPPHWRDNPSVGGATPRRCSLSAFLTPPNPCASCSLPVGLSPFIRRLSHPSDRILLPPPLPHLVLRCSWPTVSPPIDRQAA
ncbi:hypothetical protein KM043_002293 [Ampulex compressa]|nr:hypothetical protein KM043_002293 [Ampulex compressa]